MEPIERFAHTRSMGKQLTYDVAIWTNRYTISLHGDVLKEWGAPVMLGGDVVNPIQAARVFAISDIENLTGMREE